MHAKRRRCEDSSAPEILASSLGPALDAARGGPGAARLNALTTLRRALSVASPPTSACLEGGLVPVLVRLLSPPPSPGCATSEEERLEATWIALNVAAGTTEETAALLPVAALLVAQVSTGSPSLMEYSSWAVGNMCGDAGEGGVAVRAHLLRAGALPACVAAMGCRDAKVASVAAWACFQLARGREMPPAPFLEGGGADAALRLVAAFLDRKVTSATNPDEDPVCLAAVEGAWLLNQLSQKDAATTAALVGKGVLPAAVALLPRSRSSITPSLRLLANAMGGGAGDPATVADAVLGCGGGLLSSLATILTPRSDSEEDESRYAWGHVQETLWLLANLSGASPRHALALLAEPLPPAVLASLHRAYPSPFTGAADGTGRGGFLPLLAYHSVQGTALVAKQAGTALLNLVSWCSGDPALADSRTPTGFILLPALLACPQLPEALLGLMRAGGRAGRDWAAARTGLQFADILCRHYRPTRGVEAPPTYPFPPVSALPSDLLDTLQKAPAPIDDGITLLTNWDGIALLDELHEAAQGAAIVSGGGGIVEELDGWSLELLMLLEDAGLDESLEAPPSSPAGVTPMSFDGITFG